MRGNVSNHNGGCGCPSCLGSDNANAVSQVVTTRGEQLSSSSSASPNKLGSDVTAIDSKTYWKDTSTNPGYVTVSYTFSTLNKNNGNEGASDFSLMSADQKKASAAAMAEIEKVANIKFIEAENPDKANIKFLQADLPAGVIGWAYYPSTVGSDLVIDNAYSKGLQPGTLGFAAILHELGHAMGLSHPNNVGNDAGYDNDSTIMSYNAGKYAGIMNGYAPTTMQILDIAALQGRYGANTSTSTAANAYMLNGSTKVQTIWDAGGTDRIDASTSKYTATIDLNAGLDHVSFSGGSRFFIAKNVVIEHANGSSLSDKIIGNNVRNSIVAGKGNDTIEGNDGSDIIYGQDGSDVIIGGTKNSTDELDSLYGGDGNDIISGGYGGDIIFGEKGADTLVGDSGADSLSGGAGKDVFLFNIAPDSSAAASDVIIDFTKGQDIINIDTVLNKSGVNFTAIAAGNASGTILGYTISGSTTTITSADNSFQIILNTAVNLTNSDFVF